MAACLGMRAITKSAMRLGAWHATRPLAGVCAVRAAPAVCVYDSWCQARSFASKKKGKARAARQKAGAGGGKAAPRFKMRPRNTDPMFKDVLKKFYLKVHPDTFGAFPELRAQNEESMQALNGLLQEIKSGDGPYPERRTARLMFIVRMSSGEERDAFMRVPFDIRTTGADCRHIMAESFHKLFKAVGLPHTFHWGTEYWEKRLEAPEYVSSKEYHQHRQAREEYERQGRQR